MEGVAYSLRDCLDVLVGMGVPVDEIRASGGGARSPLWRQIQADVFDRTVLTVNAAEGPAYGAALLAGVGAGRWSSVPEACEATIAITSRIAPDAGRAAVYARGHEVYRDLYARLKPVFPRV
jgi:xylulokinase